jgi:hypothetical protein
MITLATLANTNCCVQFDVKGMRVLLILDGGRIDVENWDWMEEDPVSTALPEAAVSQNLPSGVQRVRTVREIKVDLNPASDMGMNRFPSEFYYYYSQISLRLSFHGRSNAIHGGRHQNSAVTNCTNNWRWFDST